MRSKKYVVLHLSVVVAMLLVAVGIVPASASVNRGGKSAPNTLVRKLELPDPNQPQIQRPFKNQGTGSAPVYKTLNGKAQPPVAFAVSQPLSMLAQKMQKPQIAPDAVSVDGPIQEFLGGQQIPHTVVAGGNASNLHGKQADRSVVNTEGILVDPPAPGLDRSWAGLSQGVNRAWYGYGVYPPDTQGDLGPNNYIQVVNIQMEIWSLTNTTEVGTPLPLFVGPIDTLWKGSGLTDCAASESGDPVVVYDEQANRWLVSQFALTTYPDAPFYECIAVSTTGDPMGTWNLYQYSFPVMNDYPKFGVWHDGYYMSMNQFASGTGAWAGQGVVAFDRTTMLAGGAASMIYIDTYASCPGTQLECNLGGMLPSDADTASTGNEVFMQFDDNAWGYSPDQLQMWEMVPNWGLGTATFTHLTDLTTNAFDSQVCAGYSRNCIPQKQNPDPAITTHYGLDAISDRLMYRLQYRDFGTYKAMVVNQTVNVGAGQAGIRWYELRNSGSVWSIYQQGDFAPDSKNRWMGSMAMDKGGNIALGYSVSDATIYPGIRYTTHLVTDTLGTMRPEKTMATGGGEQTGNASRWGDYSMMSVSPVDGCTFVYTNEYLRGTSAAEWYTWLGMFHNPECASLPILPVSVTITGPTSGIVNTNYNYVASVTPAATTLPITYTWQATGQPDAVHTSGGVSDTVAFNWAVAGTKTITVTADNGHGSVMDTAQVVIGVPPASVTINGPTSGFVNHSYDFTAPVSPISTTQPITYTWQATGQSTVIHTGGGASDMVSFNWPVTGTKTVTVTADNGFGSVMNTAQITIGWYRVYLPLVLK
jgi:hypothetical protein